MASAQTLPRSAPSAPVSDEGRTGLRASARHTGALVRRNLLQIRQNPTAMTDALLMPVVLTVLFVFVLGGAVDPGGDRVRYTAFLVPGLMVILGMTIAMAVGVGVNDDFRTGVMDRFRAMPIGRSSVLVAKVVVETGRMLVAIAVLLIVGAVLGFDVAAHWPGLLAATALTAAFGTSLVWTFMLLGLTLRTAQAIQGLSVLVLTPLEFGSSIFVPPSTMPDWLSAFTRFNPLTHMADAARGLALGEGPVAGPVLWTLVWSVGLTALTAPVAVAKFRAKT
ncbi:MULTISPECIES: ABC transporter permease [unclassified Streptomyces]|uniref:ABC transporter permease n=1 Tax=unclassified Streptomyces TaxID=2593676 RepID=UPI00088CA06F|nr:MULTISPECIES: ABC transporter permease [unclassified Streptomyces]PBC83509.1 oleandomycin transport system permease protein [Streptomyces sp. 2321.6]SDR41657.1 oleandomycin transport system permease protein [Streptomyces sp. KS_16]SEC98982.1 oleandomycin transport system permease protein [Streptomyces sp. 2133.1]SEE76186.1 oleandomycin transport system permease protein [Streptomyces sp. 2112.3]SNC69587.1 oleandomycin transport system permease protein [Streptomyces sp. 2114.4]